MKCCSDFVNKYQLLYNAQPHNHVTDQLFRELNRGVEWESNKKKGLCYILSWYFSMSVLVWETNTWRERKNF